MDAVSAFKGSRVEVDLRDTHNPVVVVTRDTKTAKLPVNKNLLIIDGKEILLEGVVVYAPDTKKAYVPMQAVNLITGAK